MYCRDIMARLRCRLSRRGGALHQKQVYPTCYLCCVLSFLWHLRSESIHRVKAVQVCGRPGCGGPLSTSLLFGHGVINRFKPVRYEIVFQASIPGWGIYSCFGKQSQQIGLYSPRCTRVRRDLQNRKVDFRGEQTIRRRTEMLKTGI